MTDPNAHLIDPNHVMFSHYDHDGTQTHINITLLSEAVKDIEIVLIPVCPEVAEYCVKYRGVETHRLQRLIGVEPTDPILAATWSDGTHLIVDGTHRYVAAALQGKPTIIARIIPEDVWRKFQLVGVNDPEPLKTLTGFSGIL